MCHTRIRDTHTLSALCFGMTFINFFGFGPFFMSFMWKIYLLHLDFWSKLFQSFFFEMIMAEHLLRLWKCHFGLKTEGVSPPRVVNYSERLCAASTTIAIEITDLWLCGFDLPVFVTNCFHQFAFVWSAELKCQPTATTVNDIRSRTHWSSEPETSIPQGFNAAR